MSCEPSRPQYLDHAYGWLEMEVEWQHFFVLGLAVSHVFQGQPELENLYKHAPFRLSAAVVALESGMFCPDRGQRTDKPYVQQTLCRAWDKHCVRVDRFVAFEFNTRRNVAFCSPS